MHKIGSDKQQAVLAVACQGLYLLKWQISNEVSSKKTQGQRGGEKRSSGSRAWAVIATLTTEQTKKIGVERIDNVPLRMTRVTGHGGRVLRMLLNALQSSRGLDREGESTGGAEVGTTLATSATAPRGHAPILRLRIHALENGQETACALWCQQQGYKGVPESRHTGHFDV